MPKAIWHSSNDVVAAIRVPSNGAVSPAARHRRLRSADSLAPERWLIDRARGRTNSSDGRQIGQALTPEPKWLQHP